MRSYRKKIVVLVGIILSMFVACCMNLTQNVSAESVDDYAVYNETYIKKRALYHGFRLCYENALVPTILYRQQRTSDGSTVLPRVIPDSTSVIDNENASIFSGGSFNSPVGFGISETLDCYNRNQDKSGLYQVVKAGSNVGILGVRTDDVIERTKYYDQMGYSGDASTTGGGDIKGKNCYSIQYSYAEQTRNTNTICVNKDAEGNMLSAFNADDGDQNPGDPVKFYILFGNRGTLSKPTNLALTDSQADNYNCRMSEGGQKMSIVGVIRDSGVNGESIVDIGGCHEHYGIVKLSDNEEDDWIIDQFKAGFEDYGGIGRIEIDYEIDIVDDEYTMLFDAEGDDGGSSGSSYDKYVHRPSATYKEGVAYIEGRTIDAYGEDYVSASEPWARDFSNTELYYVYMRYLANQFDVNVEIDFASCVRESGAYNYLQIIMDNGDGKRLYWCPIYNHEAIWESESTSKLVTGASMNKKQKYKVKDLIALIRELGGDGDINKDKLPVNNVDFMGPTSPTEPTEGGDTSKKTCMSSSGGGALAWLLCPALEGLSGASTDIYNNYVKPSLEVSPKLFTNNQKEGTRKAWGVFRDFANLFFIVLFLVVVFSQLTGVGIDNYGIKKILPKLIVAAILINISYEICQILVDLSNIVGNGIQALFEGLPTGGTIAQNVTVSGANGVVPVPIDNVPTDSGYFGVGLLGVIGLTIFTVAVFKNPAILLSLLVSALGIAIAIFFLFALLSVREAAVVVLTVISPLAFACYILPNTKKLFGKWAKLGQSLLLVYPICGLLVGGGNFTSKLLMSAFTDGDTTSFMRALVAMVVGIVPVFFIPSVLKSSIAAMGKFGATLAGLGSKASGAATNRIRKTEGYKAAQQVGFERKTRIQAGLDKNWKPSNSAGAKLRRRFASSSLGKTLGYSTLFGAKVAGSRKTQMSRRANETMRRDLQMESEMARNPRSTEDYLRDKLQDAVDSGNEEAIFAVIDQMRQSTMQPSHIAQQTRNIIGQNQALSRNKNFLEKFAGMYGGDFLRKDAEQLNWAKKGGLSGGGNAQILGVGGQWAAHNMEVDDLKDEDVAALSADRLHDLMTAGIITQPQAQRVWASNVNMDNTNRLMLGAYMSSGTVLTKGDAQAALNGRIGGTAAGLTMDMVGAYTERAPESMVLEDVRLRNAKGEKGEQTHSLGVHWMDPANGQIVGGVKYGVAPGAGTTASATELSIDHGVLSQDNLGHVVDRLYNDFVGEQNINSATEKKRSFTIMDVYPRQQGETSADYGARLKNIIETDKAALVEQTRLAIERQAQAANSTPEQIMHDLRHSGDDMTMRSMTPEAEARRAEFERKRAEIRARNNQNNSQS